MMNTSLVYPVTKTPMFQTTQKPNETLADPSNELQRINDAQALVLLPVMILIGFFMIFGILGNSLVCYIFSQKFKTTTQSTLFLSLACFDLVTCCVGMPFEICDLRFFYTFDSPIACKVLRFIEAVPTFASNQVLLLIAIDRYRKVCHPLKRQISPLFAKRLVFLFVVFAVLITLPAVFIYGKRSATTNVPGVTGYDCATSDSMKDSLYPVMYETCLAFAFVCFVVVLVALYCCIWKASRRKAFGKSVMMAEVSRRLLSTSSSAEGASLRGWRGYKKGKGDPEGGSRDHKKGKGHPEGGSRDHKKGKVDPVGTSLRDHNNGNGDPEGTSLRESGRGQNNGNGDPERTSLRESGRGQNNGNGDPEGTSLRGGGSRAHNNGKADPDSSVSNLRVNRTRTNKSTVIACAVTIVFFLSFVPHLGLVISKNVAKDFDYDLSESQLVAFNVFLRSFFVNAVANPVIYALMNVRFRFECSALMKRLFRHCSCWDRKETKTEATFV